MRRDAQIGADGSTGKPALDLDPRVSRFPFLSDEAKKVKEIAHGHAVVDAGENASCRRLLVVPAAAGRLPRVAVCAFYRAGSKFKLSYAQLVLCDYHAPGALQLRPTHESLTRARAHESLLSARRAAATVFYSITLFPPRDERQAGVDKLCAARVLSHRKSQEVALLCHIALDPPSIANDGSLRKVSPRSSERKGGSATDRVGPRWVLAREPSSQVGRRDGCATAFSASRRATSTRARVQETAAEVKRSFIYAAGSAKATVSAKFSTLEAITRA